MAFTTTEVFGFSEALMEFIRKSGTELSALGINSEAWLVELEEKQKTAISLNDEQEKMKASMKDLTSGTQQAVKTLYDISSTKPDAVIGAVGKKTELGKQAAKIRSKVRMHRKKTEEKQV
ncbi:MAG: hypothetical protein JXN64_11625 [Spirochaetes bacterium]|nr:hypothetical protein [Spirochaetota bacterium]